MSHSISKGKRTLEKAVDSGNAQSSPPSSLSLPPFLSLLACIQLLAPMPQIIPFKTDNGAGILLWSLINASLGAYIAFILLARFRDCKPLDIRRYSTIVLAALSLSLGCWACQLSMSRIHLELPVDLREELFIGFNPGYAALSICLPYIIILGAFFILDARSTIERAKDAVICKCCICGLLVGLSVGFMHYAPFLSLPFFVATFSAAQVFLAILLVVSGSLFSIVSSMFCANYFRTAKMRIHVSFLLIAIVFGCSVIGAGLLSVSGMELKLRYTRAGKLREGDSRRRDILTIAVPAIISIALASSFTLLFFTNSKNTGIRPFAPHLIIASIAIATDGRVLVNEKGMLPTQRVSLEGLPKDILDELKVHRSSFQWLFAISFNWQIVSPFLSSITAKPASSDKQVPFWRSSFWPFSLARFSLVSLLEFLNIRSRSSNAVPVQAQLKFRLLEAATQLAADLGLPLEKLGTLHDRRLKTLERIHIKEFLLLSEHAGPGLRDAGKPLKAYTDNDSGLMLFFVRRLPHHTLASGVQPSSQETKRGHEDSDIEEVRDEEYDWQRKYDARGYKMRFMGRLRDVLAEATGAESAEVDKVLRGCKDTAARRSRSVLEAGRTYVSLFAERISCDGSSEVLVYDFAKHQLPSYRVALETLTIEMRDWLYGMAGFAVSDIIRICEDDVEQGRRYLPISSRPYQGHVSDYEEHHQVALLHFKHSLAGALRKLMRDMSFIGESLETWTYLTSHVIDVPSIPSGTCDATTPAHMIVFHTQSSDPLDDELSEDNSNLTHSSASSAIQTSQQAMPSVFEYTPRALFDVVHALAVSSRAQEAFCDEATRELERLVDVGTNSQLQRDDSVWDNNRTGPGRLPRALVSSFSIDTVGDECRAGDSATARIRRGWVAIKRHTKSLKLSRSRSRRRHEEPRNNLIPFSTSSSRVQLISESRSMVTTSTASSSFSERRAAVFPQFAVEVSNGTIDRGGNKLPSYHDGPSASNRSLGQQSTSRSKSKSKSGQGLGVLGTEQIPPLPPIPLLVPTGRLYGTRITASKSVPNFGIAAQSEFF